jgi:zinc transport system ATP-binding protein
MMIIAKNLSFRYDNQSVLKDVSFTIEEGDFVAILGPNGGGKTTLAKLIIGLLPMQKGTLEIYGKSVQKNKSPIGYVPQKYNIDRLFPGTVEEILNAIGRQEILNELGIESLLRKKFVELSGGQQQRVFITLALQNKPRILILDEPTVGVDIKTEHEFLEMLTRLNKEHHITILLITHDVGMVPKIANKVICINHHMCCQGLSADSDKLLKCVYDASIEEHRHGVHHHA